MATRPREILRGIPLLHVNERLSEEASPTAARSHMQKSCSPYLTAHPAEPDAHARKLPRGACSTSRDAGGKSRGTDACRGMSSDSSRRRPRPPRIPDWPRPCQKQRNMCAARVESWAGADRLSREGRHRHAGSRTWRRSPRKGGGSVVGQVSALGCRSKRVFAVTPAIAGFQLCCSRQQVISVSPTTDVCSSTRLAWPFRLQYFCSDANSTKLHSHNSLFAQWHRRCLTHPGPGLGGLPRSLLPSTSMCRTKDVLTGLFQKFPGSSP